jgi:hypothetical protein
MKVIMLAGGDVVRARGGNGQRARSAGEERGMSQLPCGRHSKKMGPSFKDVAAKYKGKADAEATLANKLSKGEGHPAVKASADDTKSLVKWVLSM